MQFREIVAPSIKELFIQQIESMILSGQLQPGDRLPSERELADAMKVSKTVVHEGLRELCRLGFLDVVSRRGVTVADYAQTGTFETLLAIMRYHGGKVDAKTAKSLLDVRLYVEGPAFEALAARRTERDIAELERIQTMAAEAAGDVAAMSEAFFLYHRTAAVLSGNSITPLIINAFAPVSMVIWEKYIHTFGAEACLRQLDAYTEAFRAGDGAKAKELLRQITQSFKQTL